MLVPTSFSASPYVIDWVPMADGGTNRTPPRVSTVSPAATPGGVRNARYRQSLFGQNENFGTWERKMLTGSLSFQLRFLLGTEDFEIKKFDLITGPNYPWEGDIYPRTTPYFQRKPGE